MLVVAGLSRLAIAGMDEALLKNVGRGTGMLLTRVVRGGSSVHGGFIVGRGVVGAVGRDATVETGQDGEATSAGMIQGG